MQQMILSTVLRSLAAVVIGGLIGSERARHGRAAGMRTHISEYLRKWYPV